MCFWTMNVVQDETPYLHDDVIVPNLMNFRGIQLQFPSFSTINDWGKAHSKQIHY